PTKPTCTSSARSRPGTVPRPSTWNRPPSNSRVAFSSGRSSSSQATEATAVVSRSVVWDMPADTSTWPATAGPGRPMDARIARATLAPRTEEREEACMGHLLNGGSGDGAEHRTAPSRRRAGARKSVSGNCHPAPSECGVHPGENHMRPDSSRLGCAIALAIAAAALPTAARAEALISEIHYDNAGTGSGEAIEVVGTAGESLAGYQLVRYNGNGGGAYGTDALGEGNLATCGGQVRFATVTYPVDGLQNGSPDGVALVDPQGNVV